MLRETRQRKRTVRKLYHLDETVCSSSDSSEDVVLVDSTALPEENDATPPPQTATCHIFSPRASDQPC